MKKIICFAFLLFYCFMFAKNASCDENKTICLTFDDGPNPKVLKELLPLLQKYDIPATFFVIGSAAANQQKILQYSHLLGHEIENHSWGHENFKKLFKNKDAEAIKISLIKTENLILETTGRKPRFFRPPYWEINREIQKIVESLGYKVMRIENPDINTMDYDDASKHKPSEILVERVKKIIAKREKQEVFNHILVFHELIITTEALKTLIPYFQNQNYQFSRLDKIL